jgi:hypothetical protein
MSDNFTVEEIYPYILVYSNVFKDIDKSYKILTDSLVETEDRLFSPWTQWSIFGTYLDPVIPSFRMGDRYGHLKEIEAKTPTQQDQKDFAIEMMENFHLVTEDYMKRYNFNIDLNEVTTDENGDPTHLWRWAGGTVGMYHISNDEEKHGMRYHSDYQREKANRPGYKFVITCTIYYNDDYEGGEIDFVMGKKLVKYKPKAGDLLVFPSGHPDYLTEEGMSYLHGVMPSYNKNKFLTRMYWQKYQQGTAEWYENEKKYGKDVWESMQPELEKKYLLENPQRESIENGVRLK